MTWESEKREGKEYMSSGKSAPARRVKTISKKTLSYKDMECSRQGERGERKKVAG